MAISQSFILVVEQVTWLNLPTLWRLLRKGKAIEVYLSNPVQSRWLRTLWQKVLGSQTCRLLKEISYPESLGVTAQHSVEVTETLWQDGIAGNASLQRALLTFFKDPNIAFAFKRQLIGYVEELLIAYCNAWNLARDRRCKVVFVPRDPDAAATLATSFRSGQIQQAESVCLLEFGRAYVHLQRWVTAALAFCFPPFIVYWLIKRRGVRVKPSPCRFYRVGCPNTFGLSGDSGAFPSDLFFVERHTLPREETIVLLIKKQLGSPLHVEEYQQKGIHTADPDRLPVPVGYLIRLFPRLMKACAVLAFAREERLTSYSRTAALRLFLAGIKWEIVMQWYRFRVIWSHEERVFEDAVITVVANRYGAKTVLIPNGLLLRDGSGSAYLYYNFMLPSGRFIKEAYGRTWDPKMVIKPVGVPYNDNMVLPDERLASIKTRELIETLHQGRRLVAVFSGAYQGGRHSEDRYLKLFHACTAILQQRDDVCVVVKPKVKRGYFKAVDIFYQPQFAAILNGMLGARLFILDPRSGYECSATYLAKACDVILSMAGEGYPVSSAWVEALMLGKPSFAYNPPFIKLPLADEFNGVFIFEEESELIRAVNGVLDGEWNVPNEERLRYLFDPFCDNRAIDRIRMFLVKETEKTA